jgi:hypothetical protein
MRVEVAAIALVAGLVALGGCQRKTVIGAIVCQSDADCEGPHTICNADTQCVTGCGEVAQACGGPESCDASTGECAHEGIGASCDDDGGCSPPDTVCRASSHSCVAGCNVNLVCGAGTVCDARTGRCCDPSAPECQPPAPHPIPGCSADGDCANAPQEICNAGTCVASCLGGQACDALLQCDASGHCVTPNCQRDSDCDATSFCDGSGACKAIADGGRILCAGGTNVTDTCAQKTTAADFRACVGEPGPEGCPYCIDHSCFRPGLCVSESDCHKGDGCLLGLCMARAPECPVIVPIAAVTAGQFAAGKEVCVRGPVTKVQRGYDGMTEIKIGTTPYVFADVAPMYKTSGVTAPTLGQTVTVHGVVRWDEAHDDYELAPVDFIGP